MADLSQEEINHIVNRSMKEWYKTAYAKLTSAIHKRGLVLEGDLINSLHGQIQEAGGDVQGQLSLYFTDHGRFQDMKYRYTGKLPHFQVMLDYVRKVGLQNFRYVPGYPVGVFPTGVSHSKFGTGNRIAENRIAWGLVNSRGTMTKNGKTFGKRKWYNKVFWSTIDDLIDLLLQRTAKMTTEEIIKSLQGK